MKARYGTVPNLPWWRLQSMTDANIEEVNRSNLVEVKMKDDSLSDVTGACACLGPQNGEPLCPCKMRAVDSVGIMDKMLEQNKFLKGRTISVLEKEIWNAAIEAAALSMAGDRLCQQIIRELKK